MSGIHNSEIRRQTDDTFSFKLLIIGQCSLPEYA
jgi:hypothetical protein